MAIFIPLGIVASIFQLVILREFSFSIAKNELAFVIAAGFWIISCSLGSLIKTFRKIQRPALCVLASLSFSLCVCLIHLAKSLTGLKYYEATGLSFVFFLSIVLIAPAAFITGFAFRLFTQELILNNQPQKIAYAKFFAFEAIGFFLGGAAFTLYFSDYTNPLIFSLLPLILLPGIKNHYKKILPACLILAIAVISALNFNNILKKEFSGANILANLGSNYGPVIIAAGAGANATFSAGSILATSEDKSAAEEFIHMSLSAADPAINKDILFIGACLCGQPEEIAKYKLNSLDCLQINPLISLLAKNKLPTNINSKINFITGDPRLYLKKPPKKYDAILMEMPAPANLALNRYFTEDFFKLIAGSLKPKGIFAFTIPSKREILSPQFIKFDSSIINAVDKIFTNKLMIPSEAMIIIASRKQKINDFGLLDNFAKAKPGTSFFTIYHFKDYLAPAMRNYTQNLLDKTIPPNADLNPSGFLNYLILEQMKFYPDLKIDFKKMRPAITVLLLFFAIAIIAISHFSPKASGLLNILAIGFSSISLNSIIFVLFQLYCGGLFWKLGFLVALFMAGLSIGTFLTSALKPCRASRLAEIYFAWMIAVFILFSNLKIIGDSNYAELIFYFYALICGFLTGSAYPPLVQNLLKNKFNEKNTAITIYSMDLTGAFLGTLFSAILLIPFLGIPSSLLTLILLNAIFALKNLRA